jgi:hypothetical protein
MKKKLVLHKETLLHLGQPSLKEVRGGGTATCDTAGFTFCYPTRVDGCWYTQDAHCGASDVSWCVCEE